jgi:hypothetical protein
MCARSAKKAALCSVSATTRSAARKAALSIRANARPAALPGVKRLRSATHVSQSETSGLNTIGFPRAARLAAGRSSCPG